MLHPQDFEHHYTQINGIRVHYVQAGHGPQLIVMLHEPRIRVGSALLVGPELAAGGGANLRGDGPRTLESVAVGSAAQDRVHARR